MVDPSIVTLVTGAEQRLFLPSVRRDSVEVAALLDETFREVGQSGRLWSRADTIAALARPEASADLESFHYEMTEQSVTELAHGVFLLTYVLSVGSNSTRRSSIWRIADGRPLLVFHQGTRFSA